MNRPFHPAGRLIGFASATLLLWPFPLAGQDDDKKAILLKGLSLEDLSKIEVTSVSKETSVAFRTPAAVAVVTQEEIRRSGVTTIPDALRLMPGVEVAEIDSGKWAIGIRGFQGRLSKEVLVLIDGRSVYTPLFAGVYWEVQDVPLESIERIEVIRGPGGTVWGSNAVNGVINIITKNSRDTHGVRVSATGGNVDQAMADARYGGGDDRLSYRLWTKGFTRGPEYHPDGRNFDDWRMIHGGFRLDWNPNGTDTVNVSSDAYQTVSGTQLGINTYSPPALTITDGNGYFSGQNVVAGWTHALARGGDIQVRGYYDRTARTDLNYKEVRNTVDLDFVHHAPVGAHNLVWGAGVRISPSVFTQTVPTVDFQPHHETYSLYSAFLQDTVSVMPNRLALTFGTKIEYNSYSGFEIQPTARFSWTPTERQTLWAAFTRAVRTPSRVEEGLSLTALISPSIPLYVRLVGDGKFEPEKELAYELGYRTYLWRTGIVSISGFYSQYHDLLSVEQGPVFAEPVPAPLHAVLPLYLRNGIQARTAGVELGTVWDVKPWWRLRGIYSFMHLDAKREPGSIDVSTVSQLEGDSPRHTGSVQAFFSLGRGAELGFTYRYVSALPDQKVKAYSTGDVRIAKRLSRQWEVSAVGRNLLQPYHFEYGGNPSGLVGVRRSVYLQLTWLR